MDSQSEFKGNQDHVESEEIYRQPKKQMNYEASVNSGPWTLDQNLKYVIFIDTNRQSLTSRSKRKVNKIFKEMAISIGTRNAIQCRSHHQKQLDKQKFFSKIIKVFKKSIPHEDYEKKTQQLLQMSLSTTNSEQSKEKVLNSNQNQLNLVIEVQTNIPPFESKVASPGLFDGNLDSRMINYDFWSIMAIPYHQNLNTFPMGLNGFWPIQFYSN